VIDLETADVKVRALKGKSGHSHQPAANTWPSSVSSKLFNFDSCF
jgi:hypothetical protein